MLCLECGRDVRSINYQHLRSCAGLTPRQYQEKHPGAQLLDEDVRRTIGSPGEKNPNWKGGINSPACQSCGKPLSKHSYLTYCRKCSTRIKGNPFEGQKH